MEHTITVEPSCSITLSLATGFLWLINGSSSSSSVTFASCASSTCAVIGLIYFNSYPYVGGYMTATGSKGYTTVDAVSTTISFKSTTQSELEPPVNRLEGGMHAVVFSTTIHGRDYGYTALAVLPGNGSFYLLAQVDRTCEWLIQATPRCAYLPSVLTLFQQTNQSDISSFSTSDNITLEMRFSGSTANWFYLINGAGNTTYAQFTPPSDSEHVFEVGAHSGYGLTAKYFQFGIATDYLIGDTGWSVLLSNPKWLNGSSWTLVSQADSVEGPNSWLDFTWVWGGQYFSFASACYADESGCQSSNDYILFYSSGSFVTDGVRLWG